MVSRAPASGGVPAAGLQPKVATISRYLSMHAIGDSYEDWTNFFEVPATLDRLIGGGKISPVIAVMPNSCSRFLGSYYTNSPINGRWEDYIANEVVATIDKTYRTLAKRESRTLPSHRWTLRRTLRVGLLNKV